MKPTLFLAIGIACASSNAFGPFHPRGCSSAQALSILKRHPSGRDFCSVVVQALDLTVTITTTVTSRPCATRTTTNVETVSFTKTKTVSTELPLVTLTEYSSTVLIPDGPTRSIDKRQVASTPAALSKCPPASIDSACMSLARPPRTTVTATVIATCYKTTTATSTTTDRHIKATSTFTQSIYPPPYIIYATGTLTTTVPADCAGDAYIGHGNGQGDEIQLTSYPDFPQTAVECCLTCARTRNCVASAFIPESLECQLLVRENGTFPDTSYMCPLGVEDYPFKKPKKKGTVFPGPCGK